MFKTNRLLQTILLIAVTFLTNSANAQTTETLAFPGAEGFGRYVTGGRGGTVYHVTTLEDDASDPGSFRYAIGKSGARTIVFDVSGTIHLTSELKLSAGAVTIAGQTAPGDGICIADYPFTISASNVIIRFMRFRLGNVHVADHEGDGLGGMDKANIMIDHCSVSWSIDECLSVYGNRKQTVQWCIVSQSLVNAGHSKGAHGYGGNWGGTGATYHHNLLADHTSRTPRLGPRYTTQEDERMDLRNNVIYNWAGNGCYGGEGMNVNIVNNYYKVGPGTETRSTTIQRRIAQIGVRTTSYIEKYPSYAPMLHVWGKFYVNGNVNSKFSDVTNDNWTYGIYNQTSNDGDVDYTYTQETKDTMKIDTPIEYEAVTTHTAEDAYEKVLAYAGCSLHRDLVDELIVSDTRNGVATYTGPTVKIPGMIDSQDDIKPADASDDWSPWPELASEEAPLDSDGDGMPDDWEDANGLDKNDASDGSIKGDDGYTNLENYMNSIVADIMEKEVEGGVMLSGTDIFSASIKEITTSNPNNGKIYNLQGMQVKSPLTKGIYISNGKKFVVK
ncbi:MAG: pectate lyase [Prevotella sp.]|nr:pectate lyase [Prevotella sp.]